MHPEKADMMLPVDAKDEKPVVPGKKGIEDLLEMAKAKMDKVTPHVE